MKTYLDALLLPPPSLISVKDPLSNIITYGYDNEGNETTIEDARGYTTTYAYDADNDLVSITDPMHNVTTYVYDADNEVTNVISPNGGVTTMTYNNLGEESTVILPGQTAPTTYTYDEDGNELSVTDQLGDKTVYTYNNMGWEATQTVYPNGSTPETTTYAYDYDGDLTQVTDGLSHTTSYAYDAMGDLISETDPTGGGTTTYSYDLAGRMISLTDPGNNITTWTYTHADEVATEINPLGFATTYVYDLDGDVTSVTDPNSHTITYSYNGDNEEIGETWVNPGGGSPLNIVTVTYDADGDITHLQDANTNYQYTYNADDEVSTFADNGTTGLPLVTLTYSYDGDSNETGVSDSLGGLLTLSYDARDELTGEQFSGTGTTSPEAVTYAYDNAGRLTGMTRYSNLPETTKVAATAYSYDHADRMTGIVDSNSTGATLVTYGYTYDAADRISQEVRTWNSGTNADTLTYSYTNNNQLTGVTHSNGSFSSESFTWDNNGNETGSGYTTGTDNEQTASPGYTYTYDNAGEMTSETQTSTGDVWTYGYDFRGRMVTAVEKTSGGTTLESVTYTFDALDNRIGMDENGTKTWTLYDRGNPIMDFNSSGSLTMRYLLGPTGIVARQTSGGTVSWYLADHLGTVRDLINNSGAIIDHVDFSAFGTVLDESSPTSGDRMMGFAGMERDTVTGLNLATFREENSGTGRWDTQDPLGFGARDSNLYRYVDNGASIAMDPAGLQGFWQGVWDGITGFQPSDYVYYLTNPGAMDPGIQTAQNGALIVGIGALLLLSGGTAGYAYAGAAGANFGIGAVAWGGAAYGGRTLLNGGNGQQVVNSTLTGMNDAGLVVSLLTMCPRSFFRNCFPAETLVSTEHGLRSIRSIQAADRVWAYDLVARAWRLCPVIGKYENHYDGDLISIALENETIESTPGHPFWVANGTALSERPRPEHIPLNNPAAREPGRWVDAGDLRAGDLLLLKSGSLANVSRVAVRRVSLPVYNFQVAELSCYAVSPCEVLVHNNSAWSPGSFGSSEEALIYHFEKHGGEVGANTIEEYLRKAEAAARQAKGRGTPVPGYTQNVRRFDVHGTRRYVDVDIDTNQVVSYGTK